MKTIGTVKILRDRVYPDKDGSDVYVLAGTYPVLGDNGLIFWRMEGKKSMRREQAEFVPVQPTNGLFMVYPPGDYVSGENTTVDSHKFTQNEFQSFLLTDPACLDGPDRRLEFTSYGETKEV